MTATRLLTIAIVLAHAAPALEAQNPSTARVALDRAAAMVNRGRSDSAVALYRDAIAWSAGSTALAAEAYFGLATATAATPDSASAHRIDAFLQAAALDSARYFVAGYNNAALVAGLRGDHGASASLYAAAGRAEHPAKSYILLDAGRQWLRAEREDSAFHAVQAAVRADPRNAGAVATLAELARERRRPDLVFRLARETEGADASVRELVADALVKTMSGPDASAELCDTALVLLAPALIDMSIGPDQFALRYRQGLAEALDQWNHAGIRFMIAAYTGPPAATDPPPWWRDQDDRRRLWTRTMTALGRRHDARGDDETARRYYEAALAYPQTRIEVPWLDLESLLPLARIYAELPEADLNVFLGWAFEEKGNMYDMLRFNAPQAVPILRRLHLTLGIVFASRKEWGRDAYDAYGAAFQLSQMREFTRRMRADGIGVSDPPEALEQLVYALWAIDDRSGAMALAPETADAYRARGGTEEARRFERVAGSSAALDSVVSRR